MSFGLDLSHAETPNLPYRAVVALASDPDPVKRTEWALWVAGLARDYQFAHIDGTTPGAKKLDECRLKDAPASSQEMLGQCDTPVCALITFGRTRSCLVLHRRDQSW